MAARILSLGQCAADDYTLTHFLQGNYDAEVVPADTAVEALDQLREGSFNLILVNRMLDRDGDSGLGFISRLKEDPALGSIPVMLVSNYSDAQQQAVMLGALPGFGKSALSDAKTRDRLDAVLRSRST